MKLVIFLFDYEQTNSQNILPFRVIQFLFMRISEPYAAYFRSNELVMLIA